MRSPRSSFHHFVVTSPGQAALELAAERDRGVAHVGERPARLDADVDVHAAAARGLREARVAELLQQRPRLGGDAHRVGEVGARLRVEVEPQLVRVVDVVVAHRPRVERDRPHLRRPADDGHLGRADLVGVAAGGELDARGLDVVRGALGDALLEERVAAALLARRDDDPGVDALRPALERRRPPRERAHDAVLDRQVVVDDVELRDRGGALGGGEDHAVAAGHAQVAPAGVDDGGVRGHALEFYGSFRLASAAMRRTLVAVSDRTRRAGRPRRGRRERRRHLPASSRSGA